MQAAALGVLLEPAAQARPLAQQRLVRDLDLALADRDQPVGGEHGEHVGDAARPRARRAARAGARRVALALAREPQQDPRALACCGGVEPLVGALGQPRDRAVHAAGAR